MEWMPSHGPKSSMIFVMTQLKIGQTKGKFTLTTFRMTSTNSKNKPASFTTTHRPIVLVKGALVISPLMLRSLT